jgi:hypothetical protein
MNWLVVYADRQIQGDEHKAVQEIRGSGVLCILQRDRNVGWFLIQGSHYYLWNDVSQQWYGVGKNDTLSAGLTLYLATPGWKKVLFGETVSNKEWNEIMHWAMTELAPKYFGVKSARHPVEDF